MRIDAQARFPSRECPNCGMRVAANQNACPICRQPFLTSRSTRLGRMRLPAALLLLALMVWLLAR